VPTLTAETRFPLGTFRVWTVWRPAANHGLPEPEAHPTCHPASARAGGGGRSLSPSTGSSMGFAATGAVTP
jgi:hypothetical protein